MHLAIVIYPWHTEHVYTLRLYDALDDFGLFKLRMLVVDVLNRLQHFAHCLKEL